jgi:hypothetical protein
MDQLSEELVGNTNSWGSTLTYKVILVWVGPGNVFFNKFSLM